MDEKNFDQLQKNIKKGQIQSCIIMKNENIIFDYYKNNKTKTILHSIHSCTKSVVSMLLGICMRDGLIADINEPIEKYLVDYSKYFNDDKRLITIKHLLTMTPGFDWPEFGEWNFGSPMEYSKDIVKFILERDLITQVGTKMNYNSGCSNLISYIIMSATGMKVIDYANKNLFAPLEINDVIWHEKQGINLGANGLKMKATDLIKLGQLYLHNGKFNDKVIVPEEWVKESVKPRFLTYDGIGSYGYHWWTSSFMTKANGEVPYYFAMGLFGQFIIVVPQFELVTAFTSENYGDTMKPMSYFRDNIINIFDWLKPR